MCEESAQNEINQSYCFKWNDYQNHLSDVVRQLLEDDCMVDVTLSAAGERIHAHRIVLSACSTLFQEVLSQVNEDHPTIILSDISAQDIKSIIEFTYHGEVRIPVENINSLLDAARSLKICGLNEIDDLDESDTIIDSKDATEDNIDHLPEISEADESEINTLNTKCDLSNLKTEEKTTENSLLNKRRKRKRDVMKREYSDDMLASAINDLRLGQTLIEAATKHNIPRSTLYMRAKGLGGSSLQHASEMYSIPKTVLWRRIQKEGYQILRSEMKRSYGSDKREAAVKALERGENLTKVALEFKIPKTTLFRDKARLVDEGKLPLSFWKKRKTENEELKKSRLEEAVAACKGGKMSQAAASMAYDIPKTTIWRRLQQDSKKSEKLINKKKSQRSIETTSSTIDKPKQEASDFTYCEVASEIPITYIDENSLPEDSVIILTTEDMDGLNLEEGRQIIVNSVSSHEYVPCNLNIEENSNYT
ncbi:hypothetical protein M0802_011913 [Mischocyttarus mexicanus]|nr:hypothetical protein M0802_011913 [Mischocyttarus mexicanus]